MLYRYLFKARGVRPKTYGNAMIKFISYYLKILSKDFKGLSIVKLLQNFQRGLVRDRSQTAFTKGGWGGEEVVQKSPKLVNVECEQPLTQKICDEIP